MKNIQPFLYKSRFFQEHFINEQIEQLFRVANSQEQI